MTSPNILYNDEDLLVVIKPGGMLSVPGRGVEKQDCLASRLKKLFPQMIDQPAVHRLDMATSGLMVFAITATAHLNLSYQFAHQQVSKTYIALVEGSIAQLSGQIDFPFRLDVNNRPRQIHDPVHGKSALTLWNNLGQEKNRTRIEFTPKTGRTHQLRVHAAHPLGLNAPIVGDSIYGFGSFSDPMYLHASRLSFFHPVSGQLLKFTDDPHF